MVSCRSVCHHPSLSLVLLLRRDGHAQGAERVEQRRDTVTDGAVLVAAVVLTYAEALTRRVGALTRR